MKIAVMGAGAVGCYYGGMLARAGHDVVLIGRPQHVDAIRRDGLRFTKGDFDGHLPMTASTEASAAQGAQLVLFCVKSTDTESAGAELKPFLLDETLLLTLQNGVDNSDRLRKVVPQEVAAAVVYVASEMAGPGHVRHQGRGELVIEPSSASDEIARVLIEAEIPTEVSGNVCGALWAKLILNCAYNAMSAISQLPYGKLVQCEGVADVMRDVVAECMAVAQADGVTVPGNVAAAVHRIAETMPGQYSSTAQDVARKRRSEIDHLNGYVMRRGEALGVATPVNRVLHTLVKAIETKQSA